MATTDPAANGADAHPHHHAGLGVRARITAAFALGALLLSLTLAGLTYGLTRSYLVRERESSAVRQAYVNAQLLRAGLRSARPDVPQLLASLETRSGSQSVLRRGPVWFATSLVVGRDALPGGLRVRVAQGDPARQRFRLNRVPQLAVGVPLPAVDALYFEVFNLQELDRTLRILGASLVGAAAVTTLAGAAVGRWASGRVLTPLADAARVAADIAGGQLGTRLEASADSDLAVLASSFNRMVDALQQRIERDARFASDVSHELRSPLTTLATSLQVMQARRNEMPERSRRALDLLAADLNRFERLVQDLLEISRFDVGAADLDLEEVRFGELVRHAVGAALERPVPIDLDAATARLVVRADKRRVERVVANLVANGETYGGGVVRVGAARRDGRVRLEVDDAGPGVPPSEREHVFERFARGPAAGRRANSEGVGLGLSIVSEHVRLHGGQVWVEDRPGGGARFVVELPVASR
jgi:signal transduction histidine kinase